MSCIPDTRPPIACNKNGYASRQAKAKSGSQRPAGLAEILTTSTFSFTQHGIPDAGPQSISRDPILRIVTVLFADLVDSTVLLRKLPLPALRELMLAYYRAASLSIASQNGEVLQFVGDGILAVFYDPKSTTNSACNAVAAGLDLIEQVKAIGIGQDRLGLQPLSIRLSAVTGSIAIASPFQQRSPQMASIFGIPPNLASRINGIAKPDTMVVSGKTRKLVSQRFELAFAGAQSLKGFRHPEEIWTVKEHTKQTIKRQNRALQNTSVEDPRHDY